jgi:hypothetical protein
LRSMIKLKFEGLVLFQKNISDLGSLSIPKTKEVSYLGETATMHFKPSKSLVDK